MILKLILLNPETKKNGERSYHRYNRSAPLETKDVENPLNDETLTDNADGNDVPSSDN